MKTGSKYGVGIIGAGKFSVRHIQAFSAQGDFRLVAANRRDPELLRDFCERYSTKGYRHYRELLADPEVDAVLIATPHHLHAEIACAAAEAGKDILLEKPMALSSEESKLINRKAGEHQVVLMIGQTARFISGYINARKIIDDGRLGQIVHIQGISNTYWMGPDRKTWHLKKKSGGGYLFTLGVHQLDLILQLADAPVVSVRAKVGTAFHEQETDDFGMIWLSFKNGVVATLVYTGFREGVPEVGLEIFGTKSQLKINHREGVFIADGHQWHPVSASPDQNWLDEALILQWAEFSAAISGRRLPSVNGLQGQQVIRVIEAAQHSSLHDAEVRLE